jgi:CTP synthase (UTP-ammonia lyase)
MAAQAASVDIHFEWVSTEEIRNVARIANFSGIWCVPGSPYRNMDGALCAIRDARENGRSFLGTCGGFQHAVLEYSRNVLGWKDAEHAETAPNAARAVIVPLECELVETTGIVRLTPGSRIAQAYGQDRAAESYRCRYGLNPHFKDVLLSGALEVGAEDANGEVRAIELRSHPFFVATLFQPERTALKGELPPLVTAFVQAAREQYEK